MEIIRMTCRDFSGMIYVMIPTDRTNIELDEYELIMNDIVYVIQRLEYMPIYISRGEKQRMVEKLKRIIDYLKKQQVC